MIDNLDANFEKKINKTIAIICSVLGLPTSTGTFKKFLVDSKDLNDDHSNIPFPDAAQPFE